MSAAAWAATPRATGDAARDEVRGKGMTGVLRSALLLLLALAACSDGAGNSVSTGVGGTVRSEYGRVSYR